MDHHVQYWLNWGSIHERWIEKSFPSRKGVNWGENGRRHQSVSLDLARLSIRVSIPPAASASIIFSSLTTQPPHSWIIERFDLGICWTLFRLLSLKQRKEMFFDKKSSGVFWSMVKIWIIYILNTMWQWRCKTVTKSVSEGIQEMSELRIG